MKYILFLCAFLVNFLSFATTIAAGERHSLFVDTEGNVWATGGNNDGQLGLGDKEKRQIPTKIDNMPPIKTVAAGYYDSLFVDTEGYVWATGGNNDGQLGLGDKVSRQIPTKIDNMPTIKAVAAGIAHSLFLDTEGCVWATGGNGSGQLGLGDRVYVTLMPTKIERLPSIKTVAAGYSHSLFLDRKGHVWATGANFNGQLGLSNNIRFLTVPTKINTLASIKSVAAGHDHSLFLDNDGNVWATGNNEDGQLGLGDKVSRQIPTKIKGLPRIIAVAAGSHHSLFLDEEGNVWATGRNNGGQLGLDDQEVRQLPTKIDTLPAIKAVAAKELHSLFLDTEGNMWVTGLNASGQLGLGDNVYQYQVLVPTKIESIQLPMLEGKIPTKSARKTFE